MILENAIPDSCGTIADTTLPGPTVPLVKHNSFAIIILFELLVLLILLLLLLLLFLIPIFIILNLLLFLLIKFINKLICFFEKKKNITFIFLIYLKYIFKTIYFN